MANGGFEQDSTVGVPNWIWERELPWLQRLMRGRFGGAGTPDDILGNLIAPFGFPNAAEHEGMPAGPTAAEPGEPEKILPPMSRRVEKIEGTLGQAGVDLNRDVLTPVFHPEEVRTSEQGKRYKPSPLQSLMTLISPLAQAFAGAIAQPRYRRGRTLAAGLIGAGANIGTTLAMRPELERQRIRREGLENFKVAQGLAPNASVRQYMSAEIPGSKGTKGYIDPDTGEYLRDKSGKLVTLPKEAKGPDRYWEETDNQGNKTLYERNAGDTGFTKSQIIESQTPQIAGPVSAAATPSAGAAKGVPFISTRPAVSFEGTARATAKKQEESEKAAKPKYDKVTLQDGSVVVADLNPDSPTFGQRKPTGFREYTAPRPEKEADIKRELNEQAEGFASAVWEQARTSLPAAEQQDPVKVANKALELAREYPKKTKNPQAGKLARQIMSLIESRIRARLPVQPLRQAKEDEYTLVPALDTRTGKRVEVLLFEIENEPGRYRRLQAK